MSIKTKLVTENWHRYLRMLAQPWEQTLPTVVSTMKTLISALYPLMMSFSTHVHIVASGAVSPWKTSQKLIFQRQNIVQRAPNTIQRARPVIL
jgi:hypothetical protein